MDYQLVLRFPATLLNGHDATTALEEALSDALDDTEELDGHDFGLAETSVFIVTPDAARTFRRVQPVLERAGLLDALHAGYGHLDAEEFTAIWPVPGR